MTAVLTRPGPRLRGNRRWLWALPFVVVAVVALVALGDAVRPPPMVDEVTVVNRTSVPLTVAVTGANQDGVLPLGTIEPRSRLAFEEVIDQGGRWRFLLSDGPDDLGALQVTRADLERSRWTVTVRATPVAPKR